MNNKSDIQILIEKDKRIRELEAENENLKSINQILRSRVDLPAERADFYEKIVAEIQEKDAKIAELEKENESLKKELADETHNADVLDKAIFGVGGWQEIVIAQKTDFQDLKAEKESLWCEVVNLAQESSKRELQLAKLEAEVIAAKEFFGNRVAELEKENETLRGVIAADKGIF